MPPAPAGFALRPWQPFSAFFCLLLALVPVHADVYVSPAGNDAGGTGSVSNPYATISHAYQVATAQGETIRALPGTYFESVNVVNALVEISPGVVVRKWAHVVADSPDNTATTIVGDFENPAAIVGGGGGSLQGFTITGGRPGVLA
ncbi:MAG: hypothetical protein ACYSWU_19830, partial [Planctomycetota bacterium]